MSQPSSKDILDIVRNEMAARLASAPAPANLDDLSPENSRDQVRDTTAEVIEYLKAIIELEAYDETVHDGASHVIRAVGKEATHLATDASLDLDQLPDEQRLAVLQGAARIMLEEHKQFLHRLGDRLTPYTPTDPLVAGHNSSPSLVQSIATTATPTLEDACNSYIAAKEDVHWTARTKRENERVLGWAREHFGGSTPIGEIDKNQVRSFRDAVVSMRRNQSDDVPLVDMTGAPKAKAISAVTAAKYTGYFAAAFRWWVREGYVDSSPVGNISVPVPKKTNATRRTPFSPEELETLFSSPMFTRCAGPAGRLRMRAGEEKVRDGFYWIPILGALSGLRLGEIVQLALDDIDTDASVPLLRVREHDDLPGTVKTSAGWRDVPLHRRLFELGFDTFVRSRRLEASGERLFHEVRFGSDGSPSSYYSQWFGRRLDSIGLRRRGLVFHSFRHGFIDALREAATPMYIIRSIVGHEQGDVTSSYGGDVSLSTRKNWIDRVTYLDSLPPTV
jgi:integrase